MGRSPGFASTPCDWDALFRLAFASATWLNHLTLPQKVTRRFIMQKANGQASRTRMSCIALPLLVGTRFQILFTPLVAVLFIIQSPYWFTIGRQVVLSLGGWTPQLHTEFHELRATLESRHNGELRFSRTGLSPAVVCLSRTLPLI